MVTGNLQTSPMRLQRIILGEWMPALLLSTTVATAQTPRVDEGPKREDPSDPSHEIEATVDRGWRRPLASRNQFPVLLMFVSLAPDRAASLSRGHTSVDVGFDYSNIIAGQETEDEFLHLDLEYLRTNVVVKHGLPAHMEIGASIPLYYYYGGFFDGLVGGLHESLGLPNFLRGQTDNGLTRYEFVSGTGVPFLGDEAITAIGDIAVHFKKTLFENDRYAFAVRSDVKSPTGKPERLSGSGATDLGLGLAFDRITERWGLYSNASYHFLGQPDGFRVRNFFSLMLGLDYRLRSRLSAHLQFDHARPFVESELPLFSRAAQQVALGLRWRHSDRFVYEWRFVEDLSKVAPDFTVSFQVGIRWSTTASTEEAIPP